MRELFVEIFTAILGFAFIVSGMTTVSAQEVSDYEFTLEEITVTAQKREENQQKVAITMEVVTGDDIKELGKSDLNQILSNVGGALVNKAGDGFRVSIRGLSQDTGGNVGTQTSSPTVAVNTDGAFSQRNSGGTNLYDMERVEVLYGPQSTLYASNAPGGIVNIVTSDPRVDSYESSGSIEYGNYNLLRTEGMINAPINEKIALRGAFSTSVRDGYLDNGADNEDIKSARLKVLYKLNEDLSLLLTGQITRDNGYMGFVSSVDSFIDQDDADDPWTASTDTLGDPNNKTTKKLTGRMDWDLGFASFVMSPNYLKSENETSRVSSMMGTEVTDEMVEDSKEKGIEGRLVSSDDFHFKWIGGFNWYDSESIFLRESSDGGSEVGRTDNKSYAVYGNVTYPLSDRFRVSGGMRATWDETYNYALRNSDDPDDAEIGSSDYAGQDFMVGLEYDVNDESMLYVNFSTGYRAQLAQAVDVNGDAFPPEEIRSITLGAKNRFLGNKLQLNASGYYYKYKNYLATEMIGSIDDENENGVRDEGETKMQQDDGAKTVGNLDIYGIDLQTSAIITEKDEVNLSVSYLKTEYSDMLFDFTDLTNSLGLDDLDLEGQEKTNSPHWTINLSYNHNFLLWNDGIITARLETVYKSKYYLTVLTETINMDPSDYTFSKTDISDYGIQEAYHLSNFSMVYAHPDGKWTLTGYVKNLENYAVKTSWISSSMMIGAPRTYGGILSVKF